VKNASGQYLLWIGDGASARYGSAKEAGWCRVELVNLPSIQAAEGTPGMIPCGQNTVGAAFLLPAESVAATRACFDLDRLAVTVLTTAGGVAGPSP
jgi:hypothetical protein